MNTYIINHRTLAIIHKLGSGISIIAESKKSTQKQRKSHDGAHFAQIAKKTLVSQPDCQVTIHFYSFK